MNKPKNIPQTPGVYIFKNQEGKPIYIGKAKNLKNRVSSYFLPNLAPKTASMRREATSIEFVKVNSEVEALLLEAELVKKRQPKYNSELKDDKSPLYIGITKEKYEKVITLRKTQLDSIKLKKIYGPFIDGGSVKSLLRKTRKVIPYAQHKPTKHACVYAQIGLCNPCPSIIENETNEDKKAELYNEYKQNIKNIQKLLSGKLNSLEKSLIRQIKEHSDKQMYEQANTFKNQLVSLQSLKNPPYSPQEYLKDPNFLTDIHEKESEELKKMLEPYVKLPEKLNRIECFDIAHLSGSFPTASMVTFIDGEPDKSFYRHFRVSENDKNNDPDSMYSVIKRRAKHFETWGKPDLIIVDGGKTQVSAALKALPEEIALIGLAKKFETLVIKTEEGFVSIRMGDGNAKKLVQRLRDEAHRFARRYHHLLVSKKLIQSES